MWHGYHVRAPPPFLPPRPLSSASPALLQESLQRVGFVERCRSPPGLRLPAGLPESLVRAGRVGVATAASRGWRRRTDRTQILSVEAWIQTVTPAEGPSTYRFRCEWCFGATANGDGGAQEGIRGESRGRIPAGTLEGRKPEMKGVAGKIRLGSIVGVRTRESRVTSIR